MGRQENLKEKRERTAFLGGVPDGGGGGGGVKKKRRGETESKTTSSGKNYFIACGRK